MSPRRLIFQMESAINVENHLLSVKMNHLLRNSLEIFIFLLFLEHT